MSEFIRTGFDHTAHGFRFVNYFEAHLMGLDPAYGLCGGMCLAALDYYHAARTVPQMEIQPRPGSSLYRYLWRRQMDSLLGLNTVPRILLWQWRSDRFLRRITAIQEFPILKDLLDRGQPTPLIVLRKRNMGNPTENHQVLAIGYDLDHVLERVSIDIYDPDYPQERRHLLLALEKQPMLSDDSEATVIPRGFFVLCYKPQLDNLPPTFEDSDLLNEQEYSRQ